MLRMISRGMSESNCESTAPERYISTANNETRTKNNVTQSSLLRIPAEVRRLIFKHVIGSHHVHIEQLHLGTVDRYEKKDIRFGQGLWNEICYDSHNEATAFERFHQAEMGEDAKATPFGLTMAGEDVGQGYHVDSWTYRHRKCGHEPELHRFNMALEEWKQRKRLSLSCLRTCKIIHKEMRTLAYSENVFLFRTPTTFQVFAASIRPEQLRAIQYLSVPISVGSAPFSAGRNKLWTSIIWDYHLAGNIRRLKHLDITLELYLPRDAFQDRPQHKKPRLEDCIEDVCISDTNVVNMSTDWVKQFAKLSREVPTFRVVVCDDPLSMWGILGKAIAIKDWGIRDVRFWMSERNIKCLTVEQKQTLARELEEKLDVEARATQD
jgi:hypothetical protein